MTVDFSKDVLNDDYDSISKRTSKALASYGKKNQLNGFTVVSDFSSLGTYLERMITGAADAAGEVQSYNIRSESAAIKSSDNTVYLFAADTRFYGEQVISGLEKTIESASKGSSNTLIVSLVIPSLSSVPYGVKRLAEREFSYYIENDPVEKERFATYIACESLCRKAVNNGFEDLIVLRFDNLFGADVHEKFDFDVNSIICDSFATSQIKLEADCFRDYYSFSYIRNAAFASISALCKARRGHVYNCSEYYSTPGNVKLMLFSHFKNQLKLVSEHESDDICIYHALDNLKFKKTEAKVDTLCSEALKRTACVLKNIEYDISPKLDVYAGKLQRLKDIEIDLLKQIDKVCRENNIQYFLAGGSLLGAIRNGKSIPWDDDLDIGMLREDFEKFRKVCPGLMSGKYVYSSPFNPETANAHYYLDKVRLENSYFSTKYSNNFLFKDGVFLDIIVYDKTSNNRLLEKLQIKEILAWVRLINIKWINKSNRKVHRLFTKFALPFIRLVPFMFFHKSFDRAAMRYYKNKKSKYLIDSFGQHIRNGRFPKEYLETVEYREFDGMEVPIPTGYDGYLSFFYGPGYKEFPPLSYRLATHKFSRLDLGEYVFDDHASIDFRAVDVRGELFEKED